jgi:hypothetical protein
MHKRHRPPGEGIALVKAELMLAHTFFNGTARDSCVIAPV